METISAVIITFNEAENIVACLESVSWADEIVVLDSGSTDLTVDIARGYTEKVLSQPWAGYSAQRNAAHDLAECDWILSLDADERITPELAEEIRRMLENPPEDLDGFELPYKVFYREKWLRHGGFFPEKHLRLFRRDRGRYGDRAVHESLKVDGQTGMLNHFVEHYSYRSVSDYLARMDTYSTLSAEEYFRRGRRTGPLRTTGRALFNFFKMYFLQRGFLDGYEGFLMAGLYTMYTFTKYAKLRELTEGP